MTMIMMPTATGMVMSRSHWHSGGSTTTTLHHISRRLDHRPGSEEEVQRTAVLILKGRYLDQDPTLIMSSEDHLTSPIIQSRVDHDSVEEPGG